MKDKKMIFGLLLSAIGCIFSALCFYFAAVNPQDGFNRMNGLKAAFAGNQLTIPFVIAMIVMIAGVVICGIEAFSKKKPTDTEKN